MEDEAAGEVEIDEVVDCEGSSREGNDDDLDYHHYEEEKADGYLRDAYHTTLFEGVFGLVCIA